MSLDLPPLSAMRCDEENAEFVDRQLTSVIAGHPQARTTYYFYEEIDEWLGPWGKDGYPIGYGKFYNVAFTSNERLMANGTTQDWVWRTTILLQELLRDDIVAWVRDGTLPQINEARLRQAAFDSHPQAYDEGGLAMVAMIAPELIPVIATIPLSEFHPRSENFCPTIRQVVDTVARIAPQIAGNSLAGGLGPAHTGRWRNSARRDRESLQNDLALGRQLGMISDALDRDELDYIPLLDEIIDKLELTEYPDQGWAAAAREVVQRARCRRDSLLRANRELLEDSPPVRDRVREQFPEFLPD